MYWTNLNVYTLEGLYWKKHSAPVSLCSWNTIIKVFIQELQYDNRPGMSLWMEE